MSLASLFYIFAFLCAAKCVKFSFPLSAKNMFCFGENVPFHTLVVGEIQNTEPNFLVRVYDPIGQLVFTRQNETTIKFSFTGQINGTYQICVDNFHTETIKIDFNLMTGLDAKDFSELANKQKIKPMENQMIRLESIYQLIKQTQEIQINSSEMKIHASNFLNTKLIYSCLITIFLVIALSCFQSYYIKDFFKQKKLI